MKKLFYIGIALAAISTFSCQKEKELHPVGGRIVFTAATDYKNGTETRTVYSGDYTGTSTNYERIDWVDNDQITILYNHGTNSSATYSIDGSSIDGSGTDKNSTASISVASGSSALEWADADTHKFFGLYPSAGSGRTLTTATVSGDLVGRVTGLTIPSRQYVKYDAYQGKYLPEDMDYAYMVAYKDMSSNAEQTVNLPFTPVMTAVEFRLHLPDTKPSYTVSKVEFKSSTALAGTYSVDITGYDTTNDFVTWTAGNFTADATNSNVIVEFHNASGTSATPSLPAQATSPNPQEYLNFTLFVLPQTVTNPELLIKYTDSSNPLNQTIKKITLTGLKLDPGKKYLVYNTQAGYDKFGFTVLPNGTNPPSGNTVSGHDGHTWNNIQVTSTKTSGADPNHVETLNWKVQYNNNGTWTDGVPSGYTLTEDHTYNRFTVVLSGTAPQTTDNTKKAFTAAKEILQNRASLGGTENNPYDLSTHDLAGNPIGQTAANCYVVTAPGWYKFPLIYGNAVVDGQPNEDAYHPTHNSNVSWASGTTVGSDDDDQNYYLPQFYNAAGDVIDSPYILTDLRQIFGEAVTLYTVNGTAGNPTVHIENTNGGALNPGIITNYEVVADTDADAYVKFYISPANIKPGNTLLLLKGGILSTVGHGGISYNDDWPVFWSWHIWVTDKDLTDFDTANGNDVMPYNLGWVDKDEIVTDAVKVYSERELELRIAQVEGGTVQNNRVVGGTEVNYGSSFFLTQTGGEVISVDYVSPTQGTNPHYQWGRKDPFAYDGTPVEFVQHGDAGSNQYNNYYTNTYWYWRGIRIPEVMLASEKSRTFMDGKAYPLYESSQSQEWDHDDYTIKAGHEKFGPFTTSQKTGLAAVTAFNNGVSFTQETVIDSYTLPAGTYGPFTGTQSNNMTSILGQREMRKRVTYANWTSFFDSEVKDRSMTSTDIQPSERILSGWDYMNGWYYLTAGTVLTDGQATALKNLANVRKTEAGAQHYIYGAPYNASYNDGTYFYDYSLENVFYFTLSSPITGLTESQKTTLTNNGISSNYFTENSHLGDWYLTANNGYPYGPYTEAQKNALCNTGVFNSSTDFDVTPQYNTVSTYSYTSDATRNAGSILYNLWSAYRYNEKSADAPSSGDKMKTVYDPCPPGFTVPTIETYLGSTTMGSGKTASASSSFDDYPHTGARIDNGSSSLDLTKTNAGTTGYYWTDRPCNMVLTGNDKASINSYSYYYESYMMKTGSTPTVEHASRATAASIRPMVDPRAQSAAGITSQGNVQGNSIEAITNGNSLY